MDEQNQSTEQNQSPEQAPGSDWKASLPETVADWQEVQTAKSPEDLWQQMDHYRSAYGRSIRVPSKEAGEEDRAKFLARLREAAPELVPAPNPEDPEALKTLYTALGKPEDATGYKPPEIENLDEGRAKAFADWADKHNLTQSQYAGVLQEFVASEQEAAAEFQANHSAEIQELRERHGNTYDPKREAAAKVAQQLGFSDEIVNAITNEIIGGQNLEAFLNLPSRLGSEGQNMVGVQGSAEQMMTPDQAAEEISAIQRNKQHPYWNPADPGHAAAKRKMRELHKMKVGSDNKVVDLSPATMGRGGMY